jgi:hypothetical protein
VTAAKAIMGRLDIVDLVGRNTAEEIAERVGARCVICVRLVCVRYIRMSCTRLAFVAEYAAVFAWSG